MANAIRVRCPRCRGLSPPRPDNAAWPFCSERCKLIDLGAWIDGEYRVAVPAAESERSGPRPDELAVSPRLSDEEPS